MSRHVTIIPPSSPPRRSAKSPSSRRPPRVEGVVNAARRGGLRHDLVHFAAERVDLVRLGNHPAEAKLLIAAHHRVIRVAGGNDGAHVGIEFAETADGLLPAHAAG